MSEKRFEVEDCGGTDSFLLLDALTNSNIKKDSIDVLWLKQKQAIILAAVMNHLHDDYQGKIAKLEQRIEYLENKLGVGIE